MMQPNTLRSIDRGMVDEVVLGALTLLLEENTCQVSPQMPESADDIIIAVYCDSDQQSAVVLRCARAFAINFTGKMLELQEDEIATADIVDAAGELVNVIAGNLRGLVSSPGSMSAPFIMEQAAYTQCLNDVMNTYSVRGEVVQIRRM